MSRIQARRAPDETGLTVIELSVVMMLMSLVAVITYSALGSSSAVVGRVEDEQRGLADVKIVAERLSRDLRAARGVEPSPASNQSTLVIWIDNNADYRRSDGEIVTWKIVTGADPRQFDVIRRTTGPDKAQVVGQSIASDIAFRYGGPDTGGSLTPTATSRTNLVSVTVSYDAIPGLYSGDKMVGFDVRMRNVP